MTAFADVPEQVEAKRLLEASLADGQAHAFLFHGPRGVGKRTAARAFAGVLLGDPRRVDAGTHPDLRVIEALGEMIRIDEIRALHHDLHMRPFEADRRVYLLLDAHLLNDEAAAALLKDLEEPPDYATLVLVADELGPLPDHVLACRYAPQLALLPRTAAFITHGGANSVMEALHFGVPLLISPVCNDQFHQAHFVERAGAGRALDLSRSTVAECRRTLELLLYDEGTRRNLARVSASYRRDGADEAARRRGRLCSSQNLAHGTRAFGARDLLALVGFDLGQDVGHAIPSSSPVIASAAKQSRKTHKKTGLLRR